MIKPWRGSKIGHVGSKTRSLGQILEKLCTCSRGHIFSPIIMKLGQNVCLDDISQQFQILEKPCVRSRGHIFSPIIMKPGQNICLDRLSDEFENGSCRVKS